MVIPLVPSREERKHALRRMCGAVKRDLHLTSKIVELQACSFDFSYRFKITEKGFNLHMKRGLKHKKKRVTFVTTSARVFVKQSQRYRKY